MQQHLVLHFSIVKNERVYQLMLQPGSPYEELKEVLEQFKVDFDELQRQAKEKEEQDKASEQSNPIETEIVSE